MESWRSLEATLKYALLSCAENSLEIFVLFKPCIVKFEVEPFHSGVHPFIHSFVHSLPITVCPLGGLWGDWSP